MGTCVSKKSHRKQINLISFSIENTKSSSFGLIAPPLLTRKELIYSYPTIPNPKIKREIFEFLCSLKLNAMLHGKENVSTMLMQLIASNNVGKETICELAGDFFEKISQEERELKNYLKPKIIQKIFEEYYRSLYKEYSSVIKDNVKTSFFLADYDFSFRMICEAIEIFQILLSYKKVVNNRKRKKMEINYWWLKSSESTLPTNYSMIDTYLYLQNKFTLLAKEILTHYASILADYNESKTVRFN